MNAKELFTNNENKFIYLERYVNDGSPSGFSHSNKTSDETNPFTGQDRFKLLSFTDNDCECVFLGNKHEIFEKGINFAHPDSINSEILKKTHRETNISDFSVSPTSGGRTMLIRDSTIKGFLKLTYDTARIGRVDRQLTLKHCLSSLEVTDSMKNCIDENKLPPSFALMLETSAKISNLKLDNKVYEWGVIFREAKPYPYIEINTQLIPGFSLFGKDYNNPTDECLINQFIALSNTDPQEYLLKLLKMIVDCYWGVVLNCAFHLECHGQNCYFEVDDNYNINRLVIKDMDSVDKDIPLAKHFNLNDKWESYPYMCFDGGIYFYSIRPSYIYDFKVGEYLLTPIIRAVCKRFNLRDVNIEKEISKYVRENYTWQLPNWYFPPNGCWYDCDNSERKPGTKRKYFAHENPKFR